MGPEPSLEAIVPISGFEPIYNANFNVNGAGADTGTTITSSPVYTTLVTRPGGVADDGNLGSVAIYVDTRANRSLTPGTFVGLGDVTSASLTVNGNFNAFNSALTRAQLEGNAATTIAAGAATFNNAQTYLPALLSTRSTGTTSASNLVVSADGDPIDTSSYLGSLTYGLTTGQFAAQPVFPGAFESIERDGVNFFAPWLQLQSTAFNAILRIGNTGVSDTGPLTITLRANNGGTVNTFCRLTTPMLQAGTLTATGGIRANTSIEISGRSLANNCFGTTSTNGDVQVSIEALARDLTAKVRVIQPSGDVAETSLGRLGDITNISF